MTIEINRYLIECYRNWLTDRGDDTYIAIKAEQIQDPVLLSFVTEGVVILNISPRCVRDFYIDNEVLTFHCRFRGVKHYVHLPLSSILSVYSNEIRGPYDFTMLPTLAPPLSVVKGKTPSKTATPKVAGDNVVQMANFRKK